MRIDLSWGTDRARTEHPAAQIAEILLGQQVSAGSFGPALEWLDVLFVPGKRGTKPLKHAWRWRGTRSEHLIVELQAPALEDMAVEKAVRALIEAVPEALVRAQPALDAALNFDLEGAQAAVASCLAEPIDAHVVQRLTKDINGAIARRMAAVQVGRDALRRQWKRPLIKSLRWVRLHAVGPHAARKGPLADACRLVSALIGSALSAQIETPGYDEIYVNLGSDDTTIRFNRTALEDWCENAWAVVSERSLAERDEVRLRRTVFDAARMALLELSEVDHLDGGKIADSLDTVDVEGLSTVFLYRRAEKAERLVEISYSLKERKDQGCILRPIFYLEAMTPQASRPMRWPLGPIDLFSAGRVLTKLQLTAREIRIDVDGKTLRFPLDGER